MKNLKHSFTAYEMRPKLDDEGNIVTNKKTGKPVFEKHHLTVRHNGWYTLSKLYAA